MTDTAAVGNPLRLDGRHFIVTGAASGIGRSTAVLLHGLGARVSAIDIDAGKLEALRSELAGGAPVSAHQADLSDIGSIDGAVATCVNEGGSLNGAVHCAGIQAVVPVRTLKMEGWRKIFAVNTEAALMLGKSLSSKKAYAGANGSLVFISSVMGSVGSAGAIAYSMSKAGLEGMARSLALELAPRGIRVNCVAPGYVRTPLLEQTQALWDEDARKAVEDLHPLGFGEPEDVAHAVAFLLADTGRWITGSTLVVDGGYLAR